MRRPAQPLPDALERPLSHPVLEAKRRVTKEQIGRGNTASLCSSSHGACRAMSRTDARRRITIRDLEEQMKGVWYDA